MNNQKKGQTIHKTEGDQNAIPSAGPQGGCILQDKPQTLRWRAEVAWKAGLVLCILTGVLLQCFSGKNGFSLHSLRMFTTLSNLFLAGYEAAALWAAHSRRNRTEKAETFCPTWRFMSLVSISLTGLVAAFLLGNMFAGVSGMMKAALFLLHTVSPLGALLDWLLFDAKGTFSRKAPLAGCVPPLCYVTAAFIGPLVGLPLGGGLSGGRYPYPFLDVDKLGVPRVAGICLVLAAAVLLYGILLRVLDTALAKRKENQMRNSQR